MAIKTLDEMRSEIISYQDLHEGFYRWLKVAKILHPTKGMITPVVYDKFREQIDALINHHYAIVLKSRQVGVSTLWSLFTIWASTMFAGWAAGVISRRREDAATFLEKGRFTLKYLPPYLVPKIDSWNKLSISYKSNSKVVTSPPTKNALRGETLSLLVIDEACACAGVREFYAASLLTLSQSFRDLEGRRQVPYGIVIISTGAELVSPSAQWFYKMWMDAESRVNPFMPIKVHWSDAGYTKEWKEEQAKALSFDEDQIRTELECGFILARRESLIFDPEALNKIQGNVAASKRITYKNWEGLKCTV